MSTGFDRYLEEKRQEEKRRQAEAEVKRSEAQRQRDQFHSSIQGITSQIAPYLQTQVEKMQAVPWQAELETVNESTTHLAYRLWFRNPRKLTAPANIRNGLVVTIDNRNQVNVRAIQQSPSASPVGRKVEFKADNWSGSNPDLMTWLDNCFLEWLREVDS